MYRLFREILGWLEDYYGNSVPTWEQMVVNYLHDNYYDVRAEGAQFRRIQGEAVHKHAVRQAFWHAQNNDIPYSQAISELGLPVTVAHAKREGQRIRGMLLVHYDDADDAE